MTAGSAISTEILPYPFSRASSVTLLVIVIPLVFGLLQLTLKGRRKIDPALLSRVIGYAAVSVGAVTALFGGMFGFAAFFSSEPLDRKIFSLFSAVLLSCSALALFFSIKRLRANRSRVPLGPPTAEHVADR